jgi:hypothetical protein
MYLEALELDADDKFHQVATMMASGMTRKQAEAEYEACRKEAQEYLNPWNGYHLAFL